MKILHYGLQRSGTNYIETLLKKKYRLRFLNSNADRSAPVQKHFRLYDDKAIIPEPQYYNDYKIPNFTSFERLLNTRPDYYLIISKDPYSWLLSYRSWARKCNWPRVQHHYVLEYNAFYRKWMEFSRQTANIVFLRYIDVLQDPEGVMQMLAGRIGLRERFLSSFLPISVKKVSQSKDFNSGKIKYYLTEEFMSQYQQDDLEALNNLLDMEVVSFLGYKKIESMDY